MEMNASTNHIERRTPRFQRVIALNENADLIFLECIQQGDMLLHTVFLFFLALCLPRSSTFEVTKLIHYRSSISHRTQRIYEKPDSDLARLQDPEDRKKLIKARLRSLRRIRSEKRKNEHIIVPKSLDDLRSLLENGVSLKNIMVKGDSTALLHSNKAHPVLSILHERKKKGYTTGSCEDGCKVALAIEGGGMRGCVAGGMVVAIHHLGLADSIDVVYGSSAGSLVGAYFITKQLPLYGPAVYYDYLTTAGDDFINTRKILRSAGLGLLDPRGGNYGELFTDRFGKPVLNLDYLLEKIVRSMQPLDWDKFHERQSVQPLKVVTSALQTMRSVVLDYEHGNFRSFSDLILCMRASMLLPGIAGPVVRLPVNQTGKNMETVNLYDSAKKRRRFSFSSGESEGSEPLADAMLFEPIPYRSAIKEGASHVLVLRTRPDGVQCIKKPSVFERMVAQRFFRRKSKLPHMAKYMVENTHRKLYAQDIIYLNGKNADFDAPRPGEPSIMTIALYEGTQEIGRLERRRKEIFEGVRLGFARAYDALVDNPLEVGKGYERAREVFPDSILDQDPKDKDNGPNGGDGSERATSPAEP